MKIQQLSYFVEAYRNQNMSMASRKLLVSQPSISMAIHDLEQEFNTALFVRQGKRIIPTMQGDILYNLSLQLLSQVDYIYNTMRDSTMSSTSLHIGITPMIDELLLTPNFKSFIQLHPDIKINIHEHGSKSLLKALSNGEIDCAFITHTTPISKDYISFPLSNIEVVFCAKAGKFPHETFSLDAQELSRQPLILFKEDFLITQEVHNLFKCANIPLSTLNAFYTDQLSTVQNFIVHDVASGFLYRPIAELMDNVSVVPLDPPLFIQVSLAWKDGLQKNASMKTFLRYIQEKVVAHS